MFTDDWLAWLMSRGCTRLFEKTYSVIHVHSSTLRLPLLLHLKVHFKNRLNRVQ